MNSNNKLSGVNGILSYGCFHIKNEFPHLCHVGKDQYNQKPSPGKKERKKERNLFCDVLSEVYDSGN
jgi:hypothetical protein